MKISVTIARLKTSAIFFGFFLPRSQTYIDVFKENFGRDISTGDFRVLGIFVDSLDLFGSSVNMSVLVQKLNRSPSSESVLSHQS
jgi:hypothetical protein